MKTMGKMRNVRVALVLALTLGAAAAQAAQKTYVIDPVHSGVMFKIRHLYATFTGRFNTFSGTITGDPADPASLKVVGQVEIGSVDTANKQRDAHLLSPDFFDAPRFSVARFESTRTVPGPGDTAKVTGNLTIRDVTREVTFDVKLLGRGPDHEKGTRVGLTAEATVNRQDFGVSYGGKLPSGLTMLGDSVQLVIEIEAVEKPEAPPAPVPAPAP